VTLKSTVYRLHTTEGSSTSTLLSSELDDKDKERFILVTLREAKFEGSRRQS